MEVQPQYFKFMLFQFFGPLIPRCTGDVISNISGERMCTLCDLLTLLDNLIKFAATIGPIIAILLIIWGAFNILTAGGDPGRVTKGRQIITISVTGLLIILGAWVIVSTTFLILTGNYQGPLPLPWYRIQC